MISKYKVFIDSNIPMYAAGKEHENKKPAIEILELVSNGEIIGITSTEVLQEILYRYQAINLLKKGLEVFDNFSSIVEDILSINVHIINKTRKILQKGYGNIFPRDAIHVATMDYYNINYIASFDKHFKQFKNIKYFII
jgi:predicted nucleic acid-binding protein